MTTPTWITPSGNLGCAVLGTYFSRQLRADAAVTFQLASGSLPPGVYLNANNGTVYGLPTVVAYTSSQPIYTYNFSVTAVGVDASTVTRAFSFDVVAGGMYPPELTGQSRPVRFGTTNIRYQISVGEVDSGTGTVWRRRFGQLPPNSTVTSTGLIDITIDRVMLPFERQQFILPNAPTLDSLSQSAWDSWLRRFLSSPKLEDYQFVLELGPDSGPVQRAHTFRVIFLRVPVSVNFDIANYDIDWFDQSADPDSWFVINQAYLNLDPNQYYYIIVDSTHEILTWQNNSDLGYVENGSVSEKSVVATVNSNKVLDYKLKPFYFSRLPQGVRLQSDGLIAGRYSFRCYEDDSVHLPVGNLYNFTVRASTPGNWSYSEKTFSLEVRRVNLKPSDNIWIRHFAPIRERDFFLKLINDQDVIPDSVVYRQSDPWWGRAKHMRFLFAPGVNHSSLANYETVLSSNHYARSLLFDQLRTAVCVDQDLNVKYEVVYLTVYDELLGRNPVTGKPQGEPDTIDLRPYIENYHIRDGQTYYTLKPNGLENMRNRLRNYVGWYNSGLVPSWMASVQPIAGQPGLFRAPIGYIPAVVLVYCQPGTSQTVAYNLRDQEFNWFRFEFDRYQLEDRLSVNYDFSGNVYFLGNTTTFDSATTVFDANSTRVVDRQDSYADPEVGDKYLKYPSVGAIN